MGTAQATTAAVGRRVFPPDGTLTVTAGGQSITLKGREAAAVQALALALERGELRLLSDDVQTGELLAFAAERLPSGLIRYAAPEGQHDDTVLALAMAWVAVEKDPARPRARSYGYAGQPPKPSAVSQWRGPSVNPFKER